MEYKYGDSWERFPIEPGQSWALENGSRVAVHNIFDPLPWWMEADLLFVDPPWNLGNINNFYTKAGRRDYLNNFESFADILFTRISDTHPKTAYIEIGNQAVDEWEKRLSERFSVVQRWPVLYYRKHPTNILRGSFSEIDYDFSGFDEAECIKIIASIEDYTIIADPCMGRGLVGQAAYAAGKPFVGTELNKRRLAVLLDKLNKSGAKWRIDNERN